jgi:hypothetical protein
MIATSAQKRSAADSSNLLSQVGILQQVLSYVGPGHWWYVPPVCSLWRDLYQEVASMQVIGHRGATITMSASPALLR